MTGLGLTPDRAITGIKKEIIISPTVVLLRWLRHFLICSKVSLCKQHTYMVTLTLLQVDTPYNLIDNYMDGNSTSKLPPPMLSQSQLILVFWRNKMSLFWKKMKALFLQTKFCEISQIRINLNSLGLVVNKHCQRLKYTTKLGDANKLAFYFKIHFQYSRCGFQQFHWSNPHLSHVTS